MSGTYSSFAQVDKTLAAGEPLFVRNTSRHAVSGAASILVISYPSAEGMTGFNCPRVNIPFNIVDHVDPESLRSSRVFRKLIVSGVLEVVPDEQALLELKDPEKRLALRAAIKESDEHGIYQVRAEEIRKNKDAERSIKEEKQQEQSAGMSHMLASMDPRLAAALNTPENIVNVPEPKMGRNPRFKALEVRAQGLDGENVVRELQLMYGDLTNEDLQSVATGTIWPPEAQQWARERIAYQVEAARTARTELTTEAE